MSRFERPHEDEEVIFSPENGEVVSAQIKKFEELLDKMTTEGSSPIHHLDELKTMTETLTENDPRFAEILMEMEQAKETDGSEKLPGQAMMEALERYALEKTDSKKSE